MSTPARAKGWEAVRFSQEYRVVLREYLETAGEEALGRAGELGRQALGERASLVELAGVHHEALGELLAEEKDAQRRAAMLRAGAEFFAECVFPYEMAHRGFQDALQALRQVNETQEEEIKRIAYAVHDDAGQLLVAVHLALADVVRELPPAQQKQMMQIDELLNQVEKRLRQYSHELRPTILDDLGWIPAVRFLAEQVSKRSGLQIHIRATAAKRLPSPAETALYRVMQEALRNVMKHAEAANVWIHAWDEEGMLCCSVKDDGNGFDARRASGSRQPEGLGMIAMRERVSAVGGTLQIESSPGRGTEILIRVPMEKHNAVTYPSGR